MDPSARYYTPWLLRFYDVGILTLTNLFIWRCPTKSVLLPFFQKHIGENAHLDVGVGTGYLPAHSAPQLAKTKNVTFLDLNPNTLETAEARLRAAGYKGSIDKVQQSVFDPLPESLHDKFDSISMFYLLHCLPGAFPVKASHVFAQLSRGLAPGGVLYGSTVLGRSADHNIWGRILVRLYNNLGSFGNVDDSFENLEKALRGQFEEVEVEQVGVVALFVARKPIRS
ncbi:S-adenosyl-L-methionine dependent methyltransferase [Laetiporus sulphureus 93-53]|uniref:S-adenosyl-L-methionine dependent methyltransferase n=1 Tax=Laetiporus sulphureus 93-53 TaxID=1314785 RepID=A0A165DW70_9APHY|nr:S-adenosyl-L-methionine dependent methyltransferase [Laetiporus sulphureus 93-53]KZT05753.1 S-adenosyl-L-methionine dependent methyltransferase [Laetiporus sulphureus 93-53]